MHFKEIYEFIKRLLFGSFRLCAQQGMLSLCHAPIKLL